MPKSVGHPVAEEPAWSTTAERGSAAALRLVAWLYQVFGRHFCVVILYPVAAYFFLFGTTIRRASRDYFDTLWATPAGRQALGRAPRSLDTYWHVYEFAVQILDRMVLWGGGFDKIEVRHTGGERLLQLAEDRQGAILVGAHLGSFDIPRLLAARYGLVVNVLMFTEHAERITSFLHRLDHSGMTRVLPLDPSPVRTAFNIKACIDRGELVAVLVDRLPAVGHEQGAGVTFLGRPVTFSLGPFLLGAVLGCPLLSSICVRVGDGTYETTVQPLSDAGRVRRCDRQQHSRQLLEGYVRHLETYCYRVPYQWFNFYDFWDERAQVRRSERGG